jgi:hypothetical protein
MSGVSLDDAVDIDGKIHGGGTEGTGNGKPKTESYDGG